MKLLNHFLEAKLIASILFSSQKAPELLATLLQGRRHL